MFCFYFGEQEKKQGKILCAATLTSAGVAEK